MSTPNAGQPDPANRQQPQSGHEEGPSTIVAGGVGFIGQSPPQIPPPYPSSPSYPAAQQYPRQSPYPAAQQYPGYPSTPTRPQYPQQMPVPVQVASAGSNAAVIVLLVLIVAVVTVVGGIYVLSQNHGSASPSTAALSVSGTWQMTVVDTRNGNSSNITLSLQQSGSTVSGTLSSGNDQVPVTGSVSGNQISFGGREQVSSSQVFQYAFTGTINDASNAMQGTMTETDLSGINSSPVQSTWTATKSG